MILFSELLESFPEGCKGMVDIDQPPADCDEFWFRHGREGKHFCAVKSRTEEEGIS